MINISMNLFNTKILPLKPNFSVMMKAIFYKLLILTTLLIFQQQVSAQPDTTSATGISLEAAIEHAIEYNYNIQSKKIDVEIAKKKIWETTAIGLPQVSGTFNYQNIFKVPEFSFGGYYDFSRLPDGYVTRDQLLSTYVQTPPVPLGVKENFTADVTVSQLIFSGEYIVGLRASKVYKEMSERNYYKSVNDVRESVSNSYFLALVMAENVNILKENQTVINNSLKDITAFYDQGFVEETNVDQVKIIKLNIDNAVNTLQKQSEWALNLLKFQMGMDMEKPINLTDKLTQFIDEASIEKIIENPFDLNQNIDFKVMETVEKLQKLSHDRQRSKFLPQVAAYYRYQKLFDEPKFNFQPKNVLGVSLSMPIFSSGMRLSALSQTRMELDKTRLTKQSVSEGLLLDFEQSKIAMQSAVATYQTLKQNLELSKKILDRTLIRYKEGMASSTDLNQAENQYLSTQSEYFKAINTMLSAKAKIEKLISTSK